MSMGKLCFVLLLFSSVVAAEEKRDERDDLAKLQGAWRGRDIEVKGMPSSLGSAFAMVLRFDKNTFTIEQDGKVAVRGTFTLDSNQKPKTIDMTITETMQTVNNGALVLGIYKLDKDELRLCTTKANGQDRPKRFSTKASVPHTLFTFQREKSTTTPPKREK
jgi:uncharacterized protein (TIGR03067 family)